MDKSILVIDDDLAILEVIKIILQDNGYHVMTISESKDVEKHLQEHIPDMILVDFWMAGLNGRKIVHQIREGSKTKNIPVVMISANHEVKKIAEEVKADAFLPKPFDIDDLLQIVTKHLRSN